MEMEGITDVATGRGGKARDGRRRRWLLYGTERRVVLHRVDGGHFWVVCRFTYLPIRTCTRIDAAVRPPYLTPNSGTV